MIIIQRYYRKLMLVTFFHFCVNFPVVIDYCFFLKKRVPSNAIFFFKSQSRIIKRPYILMSFRIVEINNCGFIWSKNKKVFLYTIPKFLPNLTEMNFTNAILAFRCNNVCYLIYLLICFSLQEIFFIYDRFKIVGLFNS